LRLRRSEIWMTTDELLHRYNERKRKEDIYHD